MSYLENAKDLYQQIYSGQLLQAFEQYYHQDVKMTEATGDTCAGKDANRKREEQFVASIKEMHGGGIGSITSDEDNAVTTVESWMDVTFQDGNRVKMEQVAVQNWQDDQIINERFYYNVN
jgi:hypothetical protein